jgi:RNA ligase (TIGR02306 family)
MRKLVTLHKIDALDPIPGADVIEVATIGGWKVIVKRGEFSVGDHCVYFEIDCWLPEADARYSFLMKDNIREFEGIRGVRLRTVKLRRVLSQGLALPLSLFPELNAISGLLESGERRDVAEMLGIKKWEPTLPAKFAGIIRGNFPSKIPKTCQERCQNIVEEIFVDNIDSEYEVTIKLDGTSATFYHDSGYIGACSRNLDLKICGENAENVYVKMLINSQLQTALSNFGNIAVQGEIMGPSIRGNRESFSTYKFFIFDVFMIDEQRYLAPLERLEFVNKLLPFVNKKLVFHAPIISYSANLHNTFDINGAQELLKFAEGKSIVNAVREGLVFKRVDGKFSFKVISNKFLQDEK